MLKICAKCNHPNPDATGLDTDACPACGAIYAKVQQTFGANLSGVMRTVWVWIMGTNTATNYTHFPFP